MSAQEDSPGRVADERVAASCPPDGCDEVEMRGMAARVRAVGGRCEEGRNNM